MIRLSRSSYPYYWVVEVGESLFLAVQVGRGQTPPKFLSHRFTLLFSLVLCTKRTLCPSIWARVFI